MVDVKVEPHADGIGRNKEIHLAILVQIDLRIACPRRQSPHHHGSAALLTAQQLGNRINIFDRKPDNGGARLQPADLFRTGIGQLAHPFAADKFDPLHKARDRPAHRVRSHEQGLVLPTHPQQAIREHMAALGIGTKLDLVDADEITAHALGHRLDRADPVLRAWRYDPLLASDKRHNRRPARGDDLVIDLARQKPQRQSDHTGTIAQHPVDGVVGLACVGRAENRRNPRMSGHVDVLCRPARASGGQIVSPITCRSSRSNASITSESCGLSVSTRE